MEEAAKVEEKLHRHKSKQRRCVYVDYRVRRPEGQKVNEVLYHGKVNVPECLAGTLNELDQYWERAETYLFSNKGGSRVVAQFRE